MAKYGTVGHGSFSVDASTAKSLDSTAASGDNLTAAMAKARVWEVEVVPESNIRFTTNGTNPTSSSGVPLLANQQYIVDTDPNQFRFISQSGTVTVWATFKARGA